MVAPEQCRDQFGDRRTDRRPFEPGWVVFAFMASMKPWIASSPSMPRIAAPRSLLCIGESRCEARCLARSLARPTLVIGRVEIAVSWPDARSLPFRHAHATERRIDVERMGKDTVAELAILAVPSRFAAAISEVVVGRMREGAVAIAVPEERHIPQHRHWSPACRQP